MLSSEVLGILLLSTAIGLGAYCLGAAIHVWKTRNRKSSAPETMHRSRCIKGLHGAATISMLAGGLAMVVATLLAFSVDREGVVRGHNLVTVRLPRDMKVYETTESETIPAGTVLVRFEEPQREMEIEVLRLQLQEFLSEKQLLLKEPLEPDAEITRQLQETWAEKRHLETFLNERVMERFRLIREHSRNLVDKQNQLTQLKASLDSTRDELRQASAELELEQSRLTRATELREKEVATNEEFEETKNKQDVAAAEVHKLETRLKNTASEKGELEQGVRKLETLSQQQSETLEQEVARARKELAELTKRHEHLNCLLEVDLARAVEHREMRLRQYDIKVDQARRQLAGLKRILQVESPFAGRVIYRAPSPQMVSSDAPLLVVAPEKGFRMQVRLPRWEARLLEKVGTVTLQLVPRLGERDQPEYLFVERRFPGELVQWRDLTHDSRFGLAEFACEVPRDAVLAMASDEEVRAKIIWWAPIYYHPAFMIGALLAGFGCLARMAVAAAGRFSDSSPGSTKFHSDATGVHPPLLEFGGEGALLQILGTQLREMIVSDQLDELTVSAAEWALDRHRARAIRLIAEGLGDHNEVCECLEKLVAEMMSRPNGDPALEDTACEHLFRLLNVLRTVVSNREKRRVVELIRCAESATWEPPGWNGRQPETRRQPNSRYEPASLESGG
jgi:hypothetical protein